MTNEELAKHLNLKLSELRQLQSYVEVVERDGWYYGPEDQFRNRHENIKQALNLGDEDMASLEAMRANMDAPSSKAAELAVELGNKFRERGQMRG